MSEVESIRSGKKKTNNIITTLETRSIIYKIHHLPNPKPHEVRKSMAAKGAMIKCEELPKCEYRNEAALIKPSSETPKHILPLSDVDDQIFLRFSIKCVLVYRGSMEAEWLKLGLSRVLVDYYPLAGRLRTCPVDPQKLEVDCNGEGALFAEAFLDLNSHHFLSFSSKPNASWKTLLYKPMVDALNFTQLPPLLLQVIPFFYVLSISLSLFSIAISSTQKL